MEQRQAGESLARFFERLEKKSGDGGNERRSRSGVKRPERDPSSKKVIYRRAPENRKESKEKQDDEEEDDAPIREEQLHKTDDVIVEVLQQEKKVRSRKKKQKPGPKPKDKNTPADLTNKKWWKDYCSTAWVFFDLKDALENQSSKVVLQCRYCDNPIIWDRELGATTRLMSHAKTHGKVYEAAKEVDIKGLDAYYSLENFNELRRTTERQRTLFESSVKVVKEDSIAFEFVSWILSANIPMNKFRNKYW